MPWSRPARPPCGWLLLSPAMVPSSPFSTSMRRRSRFTTLGRIWVSDARTTACATFGNTKTWVPRNLSMSRSPPTDPRSTGPRRNDQPFRSSPSLHSFSKSVPMRLIIVPAARRPRQPIHDGRQRLSLMPAHALQQPCLSFPILAGRLLRFLASFDKEAALHLAYHRELYFLRHVELQVLRAHGLFDRGQLLCRPRD